MTEVIIGSRESKLAVLQSEMVKSYIEQKNREKNAGSEITILPTIIMKNIKFIIVGILINNRRYYSGPYPG